MKPKRFNILEETWRQCFKNLLWGDLIDDNSYLRGELTCGCCGMKNVVKMREKQKEVLCPICGIENTINLQLWGY